MAYDPDRDPSPKDPNDGAAPDAKTSEDAAHEDESGSKRTSAEPSDAANEPEQANDKSASKVTRSDRPSAKSQQRRQTSARSRDDYDDDDYDDEDDDDFDDEDERPVSRRPQPRRRPVRPKVSRKKLNVPTTEEELNIPKFQTIGMLGSVSLLMIIMWFAARIACNAHPDQIRDPRYVSVDQLAVDPKNAALEFQLRFVAKDYLLAGELVAGKMADKIHDLLKFCEDNVDTCEKDKLALKDKVTGTSTLMELTPSQASAEVTTLINNENPQTVMLDLVPSGKIWKVIQSRNGGARRPDAGAAVLEVNTAPPPNP